MTPTAKTKQKEKQRESSSLILDENMLLQDDESPMQPLAAGGDETVSTQHTAQPLQANTNNTNHTTKAPSTILSSSSKYTRKANIGKVGGMASYIDYKSNKDAKKLLHVILNDLDKKWDAKAVMFKQVAKAQRSLRKKCEEENKALSQKYHRLISDYDLLKKTSDDDIQVLRLHLLEADKRLEKEHTQHADATAQLKEAHDKELHELGVERAQLHSKNAEYVDTIYHLDQARLAAEERTVEREAEVAVVRNHLDGAVREAEQLRVTLGTLREDMSHKDEVIASLKNANEMQRVFDNFNPLTALLTLLVLYLAACVVGLAADPIKIVMISTGMS